MIDKRFFVRKTVMEQIKQANEAAIRGDIQALENFKNQGILPEAQEVWRLGFGQINKDQCIRVKVWALLNGVKYDYHLSKFIDMIVLYSKMEHDETVDLVLQVAQWAVRTGQMDKELEEALQFTEQEFGPKFGKGFKGFMKKHGWKTQKNFRTMKWFIDYLKVAYQESRDLRSDSE